VKARAAPKVATGVAVAATRGSGLLAVLLLLTGFPLMAGVLPEDRADVLYHSYDGGGVDITGPSILVLKKLGQNVALRGNYYVDMVSSASIDVVTSGASKYKEKRTEETVGVDYLHGNSTLRGSYTYSKENDYTANTASFGISVDMFGDLTTVTLGYSRGWDTVEKEGDPSFSKSVDRQNYRVDLSQVITKNLLMELGYEAITDEGFLNNPYRSVVYVDPDSPAGYSFQPEVYPHTHTSNAASLRALYFLPYRASVNGEFRYYNDSWGVSGYNIGGGYTHPLGDWTFDLRYRYYTQSAADFYSDLFPYENAQNYLARDKELSNFTSNTLGASLSYEFVRDGWRFIDKASANLAYDHIWFDYEDFRDLRDKSAPVGKEKLYSFSADVVQLFLSIWF
jgi:Protein of unknown function (DUF3570)